MFEKQRLQDIYRAAKDAFDEYYYDLRTTKNEKLFLTDALKCEIYANAISLCLELYYELCDSPGLETSCRSILEALILLRMIDSDELDDEQISNFKHQSALLFYGNLFETAEDKKDRILNEELDKLMREKIPWIIEDYDKAMDAYRAKYGAKMDEIAARHAIREGLFFATKNASKRKSFTRLFKNHMKDIDETGALYQRISFFAHPWFLDNMEDFSVVREERLKDAGLCLDLVEEILNDRLTSGKSFSKGIDEEVDEAKDYVLRSQDVENICSRLCDLELDTDDPSPFAAFCLAYMRDTLTEMNLLIGLGFSEIALSKFQTICEFWSMYSIIKNAGDSLTTFALQKAFDYSTRIQLQKLGSKVRTKDVSVLQKAFEDAFENPTISFEEYKESVENGEATEKTSLSFLGEVWKGKSKSFIGLVQLAIDDLFPIAHADQKIEFAMAYLFCIDVHHATGFCYTRPRDSWVLLSHIALAGIYELLFYHAFVLSLPPNNMSEGKRLSDRLRLLLDVERLEIKQLELKYPE